MTKLVMIAALALAVPALQAKEFKPLQQECLFEDEDFFEDEEFSMEDMKEELEMMKNLDWKAFGDFAAKHFPEVKFDLDELRRLYKEEVSDLEEELENFDEEDLDDEDFDEDLDDEDFDEDLDDEDLDDEDFDDEDFDEDLDDEEMKEMERLEEGFMLVEAFMEYSEIVKKQPQEAESFIALIKAEYKVEALAEKLMDLRQQGKADAGLEKELKMLLGTLFDSEIKEMKKMLAEVKAEEGDESDAAEELKEIEDLIKRKLANRELIIKVHYLYATGQEDVLEW